MSKWRAEEGLEVGVYLKTMRLHGVTKAVSIDKDKEELAVTKN